MPIYAMLLAILVALLWGINFAASKFILLHLPPFFVIFLRYVLVVACLAPFARKIALSHKQIFFLSLLIIGLHFTLVFSALWLGLPIATTVIAVQLGAPISCVLSALFLNDKLGPWRTLGMAIAFSGILVIAGTPEVGNNEFAFLLAIGGAAAWGGSNVYMKRVPSVSIMPMLFWTGLYSLPVTLGVSLILEENQIALLQTAGWSVWGGLAYTVLMSTIVGYGVWYWLMSRYSVTQVTPFALLVPVGGFTSGMLFFDETFTWRTVIGAALTIIGVAIITVRRPRLARPVKG